MEALSILIKNFLLFQYLTINKNQKIIHCQSSFYLLLVGYLTQIATFLLDINDLIKLALTCSNLIIVIVILTKFNNKKIALYNTKYIYIIALLLTMICQNLSLFSAIVLNSFHFPYLLLYKYCKFKVTLFTLMFHIFWTLSNSLQFFEL